MATADIESIKKFTNLQELGIREEPGQAYFTTNIEIGEISTKQKNQVHKLLDEFKELFATSSDDFGKARGVIHKIETKDASPFCQRPYRKSRTEEEAMNFKINQLIKKGLLSPSKSPWALPVLLIKKKDGGY